MIGTYWECSTCAVTGHASTTLTASNVHGLQNRPCNPSRIKGLEWAGSE
jgi:hypothetical protein